MKPQIVPADFREPSRVEYLIVHHTSENRTRISQILVDRLSNALVVNENVFAMEAVVRMLVLDVQRITFSAAAELAQDTVTLGFILELPPDTVRAQRVVEHFTAALGRTPQIIEALKFFDSLLWQRNAKLAEELFALEMKLRRIVSLMYLHDFPSILNEIFRFTFGQYPRDDQPTLSGRFSEGVPLLRNRSPFDAFRALIDGLPVQNEDDQHCISNLAAAFATAETVRHCIMHNLPVPSKTFNAFHKTARPALDALVHDHLERSKIKSGDVDYATVHATMVLERAMAQSQWDENDQVIAVREPDGQLTEFYSREELKDWLRKLAERELINRANRSNGERGGCLDTESITENVLQPYDERLAQQFSNYDEPY